MQDRKNKRQQTASDQVELLPIPDKLYFSIGEVAKLCQLKTHVLRYWEQEFPQLNPSKRRGNRRYYQRKDVLLIRKIRNLLYDQGFTIEGARAQLLQDNKLEETESSDKTLVQIDNLVQELENILSVLQYNPPFAEGL